MSVKITLPTIGQLLKLGATVVTDREISSGAWAYKRELDGKKVSVVYSFSSTAYAPNHVFACDSYGTKTDRLAGDGTLVIRPRIEKQGQSSKDFAPYEVKNDVLHIDGKPVYWGAERIDVAKELGDINLELPSNKNAGKGFNQENKGFALQRNQCVRVKLADGTIDYAEKIVGVICAMYSTEGIMNYNDGTIVENGKTAYHRLRPMPAKEIDGGIQVGAGMATRFDTQDNYKNYRYRNYTDLDINNHDVNLAITAMVNAYEKSAEVMAELQKTDKLNSPTIGKPNAVHNLFNQLLAGAIGADSLRAGLKAIAKKTSEKDGATAADAQALAEEIRQASTQYAEKKAEREQRNTAFENIDTQIDSLKL